MSTGALDPLIHNQQRLRIVATLAALPDGDTLSVTRLRAMIGLPPRGPVIGLGELGRAGYVRTDMTGGGAAQATVALTCRGRAALGRYTAALGRYTAALAQLPPASPAASLPPAPGMRAGDADRDAAAEALGEHFAQGRLTLDELSTRLDATLTATTHGELAAAARDLPDLTVFPARAGLRRGRRPVPRHRPGRAPGLRV
jgi:hypothetical protein